MAIPVLDARSIARISKVVRDKEGDRTGTPVREGQTGLTPQILRVTSSTKDGNGDYPAVLSTWNAATSLYEDFGEVRFRPCGGATAAVGEWFNVRFSGVNATGTFGVFVGVGDANWTRKTGTQEDRWVGGLLSTGPQSIKGEKTFRDNLVVQKPATTAYVSIQSTLSQGARYAEVFGCQKFPIDASTPHFSLNTSSRIAEVVFCASGFENFITRWVGLRAESDSAVGYGCLVLAGESTAIWSRHGIPRPEINANASILLTDSGGADRSYSGTYGGPAPTSSPAFGVVRGHTGGCRWGQDMDIVVPNGTGGSVKYHHHGGLLTGVTVVPPPPPPPP